MHLVEDSLGVGGTAEEIAQEGGGVALGAPAEKVIAEPDVPTRVASVEWAEGFANVLAHVSDEDGAETVVDHVAGRVDELFAHRPNTPI